MVLEFSAGIFCKVKSFSPPTAWMLQWWASKYLCRPKQDWQWMHWYFFWCTFKWSEREDFWANDNSHSVHLNGLALVCTTWWAFKSVILLKPLLQSLSKLQMYFLEMYSTPVKEIEKSHHLFLIHCLGDPGNGGHISLYVFIFCIPGSIPIRS